MPSDNAMAAPASAALPATARVVGDQWPRLATEPAKAFLELARRLSHSNAAPVAALQIIDT
jgi:hypothetical protein